VVAGPTQAGALILVHGLSTLLWLPLIAIHLVAYLWRVPRSLADDWSTHPAEHAPGRELRLGVNLGALLGGAVAALLVRPLAAPWSTWITATGKGPGPFLIIAGLLISTLALGVARLFRWQ
jgi:hypothetical protein